VAHKLVIARRDVENGNPNTITVPVPRPVMFGQRCERGINVDQRDAQASDTLRQSKTSRPYPRSKFDRTIAACCVSGSGKQDRIMSNAVPLPRLAQNKPAAQHSVIGEIFSRHPA
jgi:hypothetical protein